MGGWRAIIGRSGGGGYREDYRFTGKEEDIEVGVEYFGKRYYAPQLGRWVSADPLTVHGMGADANAYAYVHGRVLSAVDPLGLCDRTNTSCAEDGFGTQTEAWEQAKAAEDAKTEAFMTKISDDLARAQTRKVDPASAPVQIPEPPTQNSALRLYSGPFRKTSEQLARMSVEGKTRGERAVATGLQFATSGFAWGEDLPNLPAQFHENWSNLTYQLNMASAGRGSTVSVGMAAIAMAGTVGDVRLTMPRVGSYPARRTAYSVAFEMRLGESELGKSRGSHFKIANGELEAARSASPELAALVPSPEFARNPPSGWVWQHATVEQAGGRSGVLQLVPKDQHTSGSVFWRLLHPLPNGGGGYTEWAIPAGAPPNR